MCKLSRDPKAAQAQIELKTVPDQALIPPTRFREHHEKKPLIPERRSSRRQEDDQD